MLNRYQSSTDGHFIDLGCGILDSKRNYSEMDIPNLEVYFHSAKLKEVGDLHKLPKSVKIINFVTL